MTDFKETADFKKLAELIEPEEHLCVKCKQQPANTGMICDNCIIIIINMQEDRESESEPEPEEESEEEEPEPEEESTEEHVPEEIIHLFVKRNQKLKNI